MSNTISVQLLVRIANVGKEWDIVSVSRSQAKNFLIPKKMAIEVTEATIAEKKQKEKKAQDNARMLKEQVYTIREALHTKELTFKMAGKGTKIFGGISEKDIVAQIAKVYGITLEKSMIDLPEGHHLKNAGDVEIHINLGKGIFTKMKVYVEVAG